MFLCACLMHNDERCMRASQAGNWQAAIHGTEPTIATSVGEQTTGRCPTARTRTTTEADTELETTRARLPASLARRIPQLHRSGPPSRHENEPARPISQGGTEARRSGIASLGRYGDTKEGHCSESRRARGRGGGGQSKSRCAVVRTRTSSWRRRGGRGAGKKCRVYQFSRACLGTAWPPGRARWPDFQSRRGSPDGWGSARRLARTGHASYVGGSAGRCRQTSL